MEKITADEAARLVEDGDAILISGSGGGHSVPEALLAAVERRFQAEGKPRGLTSVSVVGVGDRAALGASHLAHEGLLKRAITSALVDSPGLVRLAAENKIEAYTFPQGVLSQLMRDMAAGRPGLLTKTGLHSFVDPRQQGARQSPCTPLDFVEVVTLAEEEWLLFKPVPVSVAFLRGTTADEDGNVTMEQEAVFGEMLAMAQATRRAGGIVIVQVKRMASRGTLTRSASEDSGNPGRLCGRRCRAAPDLCDGLRPQLFRGIAHPGRPYQAAPVRPAQGNRSSCRDGAFSRGNLQSWRGRFDGVIDDRRRRGSARCGASDQRTGPDWGGPDHRP